MSMASEKYKSRRNRQDEREEGRKWIRRGRSWGVVVGKQALGAAPHGRSRQTGEGTRRERWETEARKLGELGELGAGWTAWDGRTWGMGD